jgi:hypothetical protein
VGEGRESHPGVPATGLRYMTLRIARPVALYPSSPPPGPAVVPNRPVGKAVSAAGDCFLNPDMKFQLNYVLEHRDVPRVAVGWVNGFGVRAAYDF